MAGTLCVIVGWCEKSERERGEERGELPLGAAAAGGQCGLE